MAAAMDLDDFPGLEESSLITTYLTRGCGCRLGENDSCCIQHFKSKEIEECRNSFREFTNAQLNLFVTGFLQISRPPKFLSSTKTNMRFTMYGKRVCRKTFLFLINISLHKFTQLCKHFDVFGLEPKEHGNKRRLPFNTHSLDTKLYVKQFIQNYAEENAVLLPGRIPGYRDQTISLIPSSDTKQGIWEFYRESCQNSETTPAVSYSLFCDLWNNLLPWIVVATTLTDLCWTCQANNNLIFQSAKKSEDEKSAVLKEQLQHLKKAKCGLEHYKSQCASAVNNARLIPNYDHSGKRMPCSIKTNAHYSWDYAQQLHYPQDPFQPGPIYFKTGRKCGIFGICNDGFNLQYNYLIDEIVSTGKGANSTISYVHNFLTEHGMGETDAKIHADNCVGQNKNNYFIWYLLWRTMVGLHQTIEYSFMTVGHTKFSCDRCFGVFKKKTAKTALWTLYDIANTCNKAECNTAVLVGTHDGKILVKTYDWASMLSKLFNKINNITDYHYFHMNYNEPGVVKCYLELDSEPKIFQLLKKNANVSDILPPVIIPEGFSEERKKYLFKEIRPFCVEGTEDAVAPAPPI